MFSDNDIRKAIARGEIDITPYDDRQMQAASYDLRLGFEFKTFNPHTVGHIDPKIDQRHKLYEDVKVEDGSVYISPGQFLIATTIERLRFPDIIVGRVEGKSSVGRLGILIHATAGFMDPGFEGEVTLEITNVAPLAVKLYCGMPIAQMAFSRLHSPAKDVYKGKYQGQTGPQPSQYFKNWEPGGPMDGWDN